LRALSSVHKIMNFEQQDAYELYSIIVNSMEELCNELKNPKLDSSTLSVSSSMFRSIYLSDGGSE
jgi:hypothetical protein